jgi:hypothetical protein
MCLLGCERHDVASTKEASELRLAMRAAHLGHDRSRGDRNGAQLEPDAMIGPDLAIVALGSDEYPGVVYDTHADRR